MNWKESNTFLFKFLLQKKENDDCLFKIEFNVFIIKLTGYNSKKLLAH